MINNITDTGALTGAGGDGAPVSTSKDSQKDSQDKIVDGKVYQGSLKSYSANSGYGFIHCQELWDRYKRDVYLFFPINLINIFTFSCAVEF